MSIDIVLLDLDETLLPTAGLESARHSGIPQSLAALAAYASVVPHPTVATTLAELARATRIGLVSSSPRWYVEQILADHFPDLAFDPVVTYDDVTEIKPSPIPLQTALALADVAVDDAVYIGDALVDHQACAALGMRFLAAGWALSDTFPDDVDTLPTPNALLDTIRRMS